MGVSGFTNCLAGTEKVSFSLPPPPLHYPKHHHHKEELKLPGPVVGAELHDHK